MKVGSLFAGIGGFDLGLEWAGFTSAWQVERDEFCQKVLAKHWPKVTRYGDIFDFIEECKAGAVEPVDVITGGFPCQPFSQAGRRKGASDDRYLWPAMLEIISILRPAWVIGENVAGIVNMALDQVLFDLENEGYACQTFIITTGECHMRARATELEYLKWFRIEADFGPADSDVKENMDRQFMKETGKKLPEGWNYASDGETTLDED